MKTAMSRMSGVLAMLLIAAMMLTMVGCGGNQQSEESIWSYWEEEVIVSTTTGEKVDGEDGMRTTTSTTKATEGGKTTAATDEPNNEERKKTPDELKGTKINMLIWWTEGGDDTQKAKDFLNSTGIEVKNLQCRLQALGLFSGVTDGNYHSSTVNAVKELQKIMGIDETGIASPELQEYIYTDEAPTSRNVTLKEGMNGPTVKNLQKDLAALRLYDGAVENKLLGIEF